MRKLEDYREIRSANGTKGYLLGFDEERFFRINRPKNLEEDGRPEFEDFALATCEIEIVIEDSDAYFYIPKDGEPFLDQSPRRARAAEGLPKSQRHPRTGHPGLSLGAFFSRLAR